MRRAVLMIVDGLRADQVTPELTPALVEAGVGSRRYTRHRCVFPSATRVNSASIATGCRPEGHGLAGNAIALDEGEGLKAVSAGAPEFRERWRRATGRTLLAPALAERLRGRGGAVIYSNSSAGSAHMQDPDGHGILYHRSGSFDPGLVPITGARHLAVSHDGDGDAETTLRFCESLVTERDHALHVLWICEPDHSQHRLELGSPEHLEVVAGADRCVRHVAATVERLREAGDELLLVLCSDHGHETISEIVPVEELLVHAGLKDSATSSDVVHASSGMGALLYLAPSAMQRRDAIAAWLGRQSWCHTVHAGDDLAQLGLPTGTELQLAFSMAKRDARNRYGVPGLGAVAADPFMRTDGIGRGQHGGLGRYETRPFLMISGPGVTAGEEATPTCAVDIAPTILDFLGEDAAGTHGRSLLAPGQSP